MSEQETYILEWISEVSEKRPELGGRTICPYASDSKFLIKETPIDDIVPEPGHDVIIFIVESFWRPYQVEKWAKLYNKKYPYYKFFEDCVNKNTLINGIKTNNSKYNLILCQSKQKLRKIRENLSKSDYYQYWDEEYLKYILGDDYELITDVQES
jgi:hypothetical protein